MRVSIQRATTVAEILADIRARYGSRAQVAARVRSHPEDVLARVALHDLDEYAEDDPSSVIRETREIVIPDDRLDQLTARRIQLLVALKPFPKGAPSVRALAKAAGRDVKNVSEDVRALADLGLVVVHEGSRGAPNRIALPGGRIDLHLVES